jgi:thioredoxin-related protein
MLIYLYGVRPPGGLGGDLSKEAFARAEPIKWYSYAEGVALGKKREKKVFLFFWAEWCTYCRKMDAETFSHPPVIAYLNDNFVSVRINSDRERKTASEYFVNGVPTSWFLTENGEKISNLPGYVPAQTFLPVLKFIDSDSYKTMTFGSYLKNM